MNATKLICVCAVVAVLSAGGGYWLAHRHADMAMSSAKEGTATDGTSMAPSPQSEKKVLYWYDPMVPSQHFDKPGPSPFMDMALVPKYAGNSGDASGVSIDPGVQQNLALRRATVVRKALSQPVEVVGTVMFNERDVAVVQTRSSGFVERAYARAPGDVIAVNAPLADLLIPEWTGAQTEFLALRRHGDAALIAAARQRLQLLGMPLELIAQVERTGKPQVTVTFRSPIEGVIETLDVRQGMSIGMGMTLAKIVSIGTVWLEAAVPESQADRVTEGRPLKARLSAYPEECFHGRVIAVLPETNPDTRTLRVRAEFPNPEGRLRPGMYAQVQIEAGDTEPQLWVPSEALIRTGKRTLVIVEKENGSFTPVEIETGAEAQGKTAVFHGLEDGQTVVVSGQFLIDSEASLTGVLQRLDNPREEGSNMGENSEIDSDSMTTPKLHHAEGKVEAVSPHEITLSHGPIPSVGWGAMTMPFTLAQPELAKALQPGDRIRFAFTSHNDQFEIQWIEKTGDQP